MGGPQSLDLSRVGSAPMTVLLYDNPVSGNCYKVRLLLDLLGIEFERRELSSRRSLGAPRGARRAQPLAQRADPGAGGRPPAGRVKRDPLVLRRRHAATCPTIPTSAPRCCSGCSSSSTSTSPRSRWSASGSGSRRDRPPAAEIEAKRTAGRAALDVMERHLGDREYFVGERFTIADIALYAYTHVAPEGGFDLGPYPAVRVWLDRVAAQPGIVPITA